MNVHHYDPSSLINICVLYIYTYIYINIIIIIIIIYIYEARSKWLKTTLVLPEFFVRDMHETL